MPRKLVGTETRRTRKVTITEEVHERLRIASMIAKKPMGLLIEDAIGRDGEVQNILSTLSEVAGKAAHGGG